MLSVGISAKTHSATFTASELAKAVYGNFHLHQFLIKVSIFDQFNEFLLGMFFYYLK
jgi:hypothetical protein